MVPSLVIAGIGVLLLIVVLVTVLPRFTRVGRAAAELRDELARGRAALPAVRRRHHTA